MKSAIGLTLVGWLLAGCVPSLNPLYLEENLVFEPELLGVWAEKPGDKERWTFERAGDKAYRVVYEDDEGRGEFDVHLLKLGEKLYVDFFPDGEAMEGLQRNGFYKFHWLPAHTFARVDAIEPELKMAFMDADWILKHLSANENSIAHVRRGDKEVILTASTKALQTFVREHASEAFGDLSNLRRVKAAE